MQGNQRQTHLAYMAGIMDADGCFMIIKQKRGTFNKTSERAFRFPKKVDKWNVSYMPAMKIAMIEEEAMKFICDELGFGKYHIDGARKDRPNSKPIFNWYLRGRMKVEKALKDIIPYLKVKKDRANHLLNFCQHLNSLKNPCYLGLDLDELNYREDSYIKMREFNGNKVAATTKSSRPEKVSDSLDS